MAMASDSERRGCRESGSEVDCRERRARGGGQKRRREEKRATPNAEDLSPFAAAPPPKLLWSRYIRLDSVSCCLYFCFAFNFSVYIQSYFEYHINLTPIS